MTVSVTPPSGSGVVEGIGLTLGEDNRERSGWTAWLEVSTSTLYLKRWTGAVWELKPAFRWTGSSWDPIMADRVKYWDGAGWVPLPEQV